MGYTYHRKRESINVPNVKVLKPGGGYSGDHRKSTSPNTWQFSLKKKKKKERKKMVGQGENPSFGVKPAIKSDSSHILAV